MTLTPKRLTIFRTLTRSCATRRTSNHLRISNSNSLKSTRCWSSSQGWIPSMQLRSSRTNHRRNSDVIPRPLKTMTSFLSRARRGPRATKRSECQPCMRRAAKRTWGIRNLSLHKHTICMSLRGSATLQWSIRWPSRKNRHRSKRTAYHATISSKIWIGWRTSSVIWRKRLSAFTARMRRNWKRLKNESKQLCRRIKDRNSFCMRIQTSWSSANTCDC